MLMEFALKKILGNNYMNTLTVALIVFTVSLKTYRYIFVLKFFYVSWHCLPGELRIQSTVKIPGMLRIDSNVHLRSESLSLTPFL